MRAYVAEKISNLSLSTRFLGDVLKRELSSGGFKMGEQFFCYRQGHSYTKL